MKSFALQFIDKTDLCRAKKNFTMFSGYRNPLQCVEFELASASSHHPYDEINLNLVEDSCSQQQNHSKSSNNGSGRRSSSNNAAAGFGVDGGGCIDEFSTFQVVSGGIYNRLVHIVATVDIVYSLLRLGLYFLELLTGNFKHKSSYSSFFNSTDDSSSNSISTSPIPTTATVFDDFEQASAYKMTLSSSSSPLALAQVSHEKSNQTLIVAIWSGKFLVCIVQLIVASALYSGSTNLKDTRICIRNCRIWMWTSCFLNLLLLFEICGIFILGKSNEHVLAIITCAIEFIARIAGLGLVWKFIKELKFQLCDLEQDEHIIYYELCPSPAASTSRMATTSTG